MPFFGNIKYMIDFAVVSDLVLRISWNCTFVSTTEILATWPCQLKAKKFQNLYYQNQIKFGVKQKSYAMLKPFAFIDAHGSIYRLFYAFTRNASK